MSFAVECPECGSGLEVEEEHRGWTVRCPHCRHEFRPGTAAPATIAPPASSGGEADPKPKRRRRSEADLDDDDDYDDHAWALGEVSGPATSLKVIGWIGMGFSLLGLGIWVVLVAMVMSNPPGPKNGGGQDRDEVLAQAVIYIPQSCVAFGISIVMLIGAGKMSRLENYGWAQAASVVGMIPCISPCCLLGLPFGIWSLTVLNRPDIQRAFRRARRGSFDD